VIGGLESSYGYGEGFWDRGLEVMVIKGTKGAVDGIIVCWVSEENREAQHLRKKRGWRRG
jgi:hypothetical protein